MFAAATAAVNWIKYVSLRSTYAFDLGFFHNVAFNQALGRDTVYLLPASWFAAGDFEGSSVYRANHFSPMRLVLLPRLYRLWPDMAPPCSPYTVWMAAPPLLAVAWLLLAGLYYQLAYGIFFPWARALHRSALHGGAVLALLDRLPAFFRALLAPAVVGLLTPEAFAVALPLVAGAASVRWPAFPPHDLQHLSPAVVAIFWALAATAIRVAPRLLRTRPRAGWTAALFAAATLIPFGHFAAATLRTYVVGGVPRYESLGRLDAALPADATVMVPKRLAARFSAHSRVLTYEALPLGTASRPSPEAWLAILAEVLAACDLVATEQQPWLDRLVVDSGRFAPPLVVGRFHLFLARADAPRPTDPDRHLQRALRWDEMPAQRRRWTTLHAEAAPPSTPPARRPVRAGQGAEQARSPSPSGSAARPDRSPAPPT